MKESNVYDTWYVGFEVVGALKLSLIRELTMWKESEDGLYFLAGIELNHSCCILNVSLKIMKIQAGGCAGRASHLVFSKSIEEQSWRFENGFQLGPG